MFQINDDHVKFHKGPQFGDAGCKSFETPHLSLSSLVICEGEKDVVTAYCNGASALTFTSGAGALPAEITLDDRYNKVYIVYDNDEKGEEGAKKTREKAIWCAGGVVYHAVEPKTFQLRYNRLVQ